MNTQSSKEPEVRRTESDRSNSPLLSEQQEQLLMRLCDCELGLLGRWRAQKLLRSSVVAREFVAQSKSLRSTLSEVKYSAPVDLWSRIDAAIDNEEFAERLVAPRADLARSAPWRINRLAESLRQLGWGVSGVAVTAGLLVVAVRFGRIPTAATTSSFGAVKQATFDSDGRVSSDSSSGIYILNDHAQPAMEVDWMRSAGSVRVIPDSRDRNTILWVKRLGRAERTGRSAVAGISGDMTASGSVLPSAIPQSDN